MVSFPPFGGLQAIRDGVIEASINHEKGYVQSKEMIDIYSTREPQLAFHQRISFCLDIHNMSVKVSVPGCSVRGRDLPVSVEALSGRGSPGPRTLPVGLEHLLLLLGI